MTALIIIFSILLVIALVLLIRIRVVIDYKGEDIKLHLRILGIPIRLLPRKQKKQKIKLSDYSYKKQQKALLKKPKKEKKKKKKESVNVKEKPPLSEAIPMIGDIVKFLLKKFFGHLRIDVTDIKITIGTDDAAKTAIMFGIVNQAAAALFDLLSTITNVKKNRKNEIAVYADFTSEKTVININIGFSLRIWHLFSIALGTLFKYLKNMLKSK